MTQRKLETIYIAACIAIGAALGILILTGRIEVW